MENISLGVQANAEFAALVRIQGTDIFVFFFQLYVPISQAQWITSNLNS